MKKIFYFFILTILVAVAILTYFNIFTYLKFNSRISEIRYCQFEYIDNNFYISLAGGQRENPYKIDGNSNNMIDYAIIEIKPKNAEFKGEEILLYINGIEYTASLEKNPYNNSFMSDLQLHIDKTDDVKFELTLSDYTLSDSMIEITNSFHFTARDCLKTMIDYYPDLFRTLNYKNSEIHITLLGNCDIADNIKVWYIAIFQGNREKYSVCMDTISGEILSTNFK